MPAAKTKPDNKDFMKQAQAGLAIARASLVVAGSYPMAKTDPAVDTQTISSIPKRDNGQPTAEEMIRINALSRSGNLDPASLYAFDASISTQRIDSYLTRMDITTLTNYVNGANKGVPVQYSHQSQKSLPLGRSYYAVMDDDPQLIGMKRAVASAYVLRNNSANSIVNSNEVIASIDSGITAEVSVGFEFFPGTPENKFQDRTWYRCSICGGDFLASDWWSEDPDDCQHYPGELYRFDGGQQEQMCYLDVVNAYLTEFSPVFAGSCDGAVVLKAQRAAEAGVLTRSQIMHLEEAYRTRLLDRTIQTLPAIKPKKEPSVERNEKDMAATKAQLEAAALDGQKRALASLVKHVMDSRAMDDTEMALCQKAMDHIAAGEVDMANDCLGQLMAPATYESTDDESRAEGDAEPGQTMALEDVDTETAADTLNPDLNQNDTLEGAGDQGPEGRGADIISLSLVASERLQFSDLKKENTALKRQVRELKPLAEIGTRYRDDLVERVVKQAVRADMGSEAETLELCRHLPIGQIERLFEQYRTIGDMRLGQVDLDGAPLLMGGRQTIAMDPNTPAFAQGVVQGAANRAAERKDYGSYR